MWRACSLQSHIHYLAGGKATPFPHYVLIIVNRLNSKAARRRAGRSGNPGAISGCSASYASFRRSVASDSKEAGLPRLCYHTPPSPIIPVWLGPGPCRHRDQNVARLSGSHA
jgi:hypothetical protein